MTCFLSVAITALAVLSSQALGSLGSTAPPHVAMVRSMFENDLELKIASSDSSLSLTHTLTFLVS